MIAYKRTIYEDVELFKKFLSNNKEIESKQQFKKLSAWVRRLFYRLVVNSDYKKDLDVNFILDKLQK